ncbi:M16 family metallopeptidase [Paremcibacter congregatus]|uniref:M16 family metallopeptidase n=1 Tax=Paremcibacter congregatus TaxID=2043170 RepID=UPI003A95A0F2
MKFKTLCLAAAAGVVMSPTYPAFQTPVYAAESRVADAIQLDHQKFTLDNGLTVIVHEDHKAPVVFVGVWYHVGSKDEPVGKTGFAHLFEHLMFNGTENYDKDYFKPLQEIGATGMNGTTWLDRTNYYQTVPTGGLDRALWMESERMGHLLGAISQEKLDEQRDVVKNEKRQGDNRPYAMAEYLEAEGLFPKEHPYHHSTIGSMEDLSNASLEDVKGWFTKYYGATNAVVVLAGDIDVETAKAKMNAYFADVNPGVPLTRKTSWVPNRTENTTEVMYDKVPQPQVRYLWAVPGRTSQDVAELTLTSAVLGNGKNARLYKKLVHEMKLATAVSAYVQKFELASIFSISATLKPDTDVDQVKQIIENTLAEFLENGPEKNELKRVKAILDGDTIRSLESVSGKGRMLAKGQLYANDPNFINRSLAWMNGASRKAVQNTAQKWLSDGSHQLTILPHGDHKATTATADRSVMPAMTKTADLQLPELQKTTLSNGITVVLAERHAVPVVNMSIQFDAGRSTDVPGKEGAANFAFGLMNEGTKSLTSLEMANRKEMLGADIGFSNNRDSSSISLSALKKNLNPSIALWADVVQNPGYRPEDLERDRAIILNQIEQAKVNPRSITMNLLTKTVYGPDHPYGLNSTGTEASIKAMTREDLFAFNDAWIRPDKATIFVVGDTTLDAITPVLEKHFGDWKTPKTSAGKKVLPPVALQDKTRILLVDKPGSPQASILAGHLAPSNTDDRMFNIKALNEVLGGNFSSRLNMNLREDKGWAYGAYSGLFDAKAQGLYLFSAPVQIDKTAEAMQEVLKEVRNIRTDMPPTEEELALIRKSKILTLPGKFESGSALLGYMMDNANKGRAHDYAITLPAKYQALNAETIYKTAQDILHPDAITWIVVGDLSKIEQKIRDLDLGDVTVVDADGKIVE